MKRYCFAISLFLSLSIFVSAQDKAAVDRAGRYVQADEPEVRANVERWQDMKFGMIIHWGVYSQIGAIESWSLCPEDIWWMHQPEGMSYNDYRTMYENLYRVFNPVWFNPSDWAEAAKNAGMKYVIFTTKHHDGFNMYDTAFSDYKVTSEYCPFHTDSRSDITKEVLAAFREKGLDTGIYYSAIDWHSNDFWWDFFPPKDRYINYDPVKYPDRWQNYKNFVINQINELTSGKYGDIQTVWIDHTHVTDKYDAPYPWEDILKTVRKNQPGAMLVCRGVEGKYENYITPEQTIPDHILDCPWESCFTMTRSWAYRPGFEYKSTATILSMLVKIVSRGGNLLLNVAPGPDGRLEDTAIRRLKEIGEWMSVNSEGIYGTKPYALDGDSHLFCTSKDGYIYVFYVPDDESIPMPKTIYLPGIESSNVSLLGTGKKLGIKSDSSGTTVSIPTSLSKSFSYHHIWCLKVRL